MRGAALGLIMMAALLAACDTNPAVEVTNASPEQVANAVRESGLAEDLQKPGKWVMRASLVDIKAPGMPPQQLEAMKQAMGKAAPVERCVTAEDLKQATTLIGRNPAGCTFDRYRLSDGKLDGEARCKMGEMTQRMVMKGTFSSEMTETTLTSELSGGPQPMTMTMNVKAQRLGPC